MDEPDGAFVFSGKVDIESVAERLGVEIEPEGFETVGGLHAGAARPGARGR